MRYVCFGYEKIIRTVLSVYFKRHDVHALMVISGVSLSIEWILIRLGQ